MLNMSWRTFYWLLSIAGLGCFAFAIYIQMGWPTSRGDFLDTESPALLTTKLITSLGSAFAGICCFAIAALLSLLFEE